MILKTPDGIEFEAFVDGPDDATAGVLLIHDWWGVLDYNKQWAERLAALGYKVAVVDLYDGERARTAEEAGEFMRTLDQEIADSKLMAAMDYLKLGGRSLGVLGWSFGGRQAMQAALLDPDAVKATAIFYCRMVTNPDDLAELGGPVLTVYAENERTWPDKMEKFNQAMEQAGKSVESISYDADHGFVNPDSERFNEAAAEDSWAQVREFFKRHLG